MRLIDTEQTEKRWFTELHGNFKDDYAKGFQAGLLAVIRQEAIEAEPVRHSKWIGFPNNGVWNLKCDNCHRIIPFGQTPETMHYCPQCGAKMDEGSE